MVSFRRYLRLFPSGRMFAAGCVAGLVLLAAPSLARAQGKHLPLDIQLGYERNDVHLVGPESEGTQSTTDTEYSETPVLKIISPIKLGCLFNEHVWDRGKDTQRNGCFGFGLRASGAQKHLEGRWFALDADPSAEPTYEYRSDQLAGELLLGQLSEVSLAFGVSLRAGINNYDLSVFNGDQRLFGERNRFAGFASWAVYVDLQTIFWPFIGVYNWPLSPVFFLYSYEQTFPGYNLIQAPNINGRGNIDVDFRTRTQTLTLEVMF